MSKIPEVPLYIRVSHEDQVQGSGLPIQLRDCKAAAEREGFKPGIVMADEGESAKTADRPQFLKLMEYIRENRPPAVVVWKLDRLARNSLDSQLFRAKLKEYGTRLISATEAIPDDYSGKLFADIISAIAEYDNSLRADRCRNGMVYRAQAGYWVTTPPLGYKIARTPDDKPTLEPDNNAPHIVHLFEMVADGHSQRDARAEVHRRGLRTKKGKPLAKQAVSRILVNAAYAGWLTGRLVDPVAVKGQWPAIISQALFDRVQVRLKRGTQIKRDSVDFPLRGLLACHKCGKLLTASFSKGRGGTYAYYHCHDCKGVRIRREEAEEVITGLVEGLAAEEGMLDFMEVVIGRFVKSRFQPAKKQKERLLKRMQALEGKIDRLVEMRLEGNIDRERYDKKYAQLDEELLYARNDYNEADKEKINILGEFRKARGFLSDPGVLWKTASPGEKHLAFPILFDSPLVVRPKKKGRTPIEGSTCPIWWALQDRGPTPDIGKIVAWLGDFRAFRLAREAA